MPSSARSRWPRLGVLLAVCLPLAAQTPKHLSLTDAVRMAIEGNATRQALERRVDAATGFKTQAGLKPNLNFMFQTENTRGWGTPAFSYPRDTDNFLLLNQRVEVAGKRERRVDLATENIQRAQSERDLFDRQLTLRVKSAYWNAAAAEQAVKLARDQSASFAALVENNRQRVKEGVLAEADLLRSELELQRLEATHELARGDARKQLLVLYREMGVEGPEAATFDPLEAPLSPAPAADPEQRVELQLARNAIRAAQANVKLQQANSMPDPLFVYGYKRTAGYNTLVGGLQIDLRTRNKNQGAIAAAQADVRAAESSAQAVNYLVRAEVKVARSEYDTRLNLATSTWPRINKSAADSVRLARGAYREGGMDLIRLIDAERVALDSALQQIRALADLRTAEAALEYAMGASR